MTKEVKNGKEFVECLLKMSPEELLGLAKWLGIKILSDQVDLDTHHAIPREGADIIDDLIVKYASYGRKDRRFLLRELQRITRR